MVHTQSDLAQAWMHPRPDVMGAAIDLSVIAEAAQADPAFGRLADAIGMGPAKFAVLTSGFRALGPDYLKSIQIQPDETKAAETRGAVYQMVSGMTKGLSESDIVRISGTVYDDMRVALLARGTGTGASIGQMSQMVAAEVMKAVPPEHLKNPPIQTANVTGEAKDFYDELGRNPLDRLIVGNRIAGFYSGSTTYSGLAGTTYDPSRGLSSLTPQNFPTSEFARAGLDYGTTMLLWSQGFGPQAIILATSLTRELGIDLRGNIGAVARLTRDVRGIDTSLRTIRSLSDEVDAQRENARLARERGDHAAAAEHDKRAEEARKKRDDLETKERERIRTSHPDRPGLVNDFDNTATAIKGKGAQIDADLKAGRITQEQADARQKARAEQATAARIQKKDALVQAEGGAAANPAAAPPTREAEISQTVVQVVQPQGREAARADAADLLSGDTAAPGTPVAPTAQAADASPVASAPAQQAQTAAAKPPEDPKKRGNTPSLG